jgi:DnaJ-class molecular chaperone
MSNRYYKDDDKCSWCYGHGFYALLRPTQRDQKAHQWYHHPCPHCGGSGKEAQVFEEVACAAKPEVTETEL